MNLAPPFLCLLGSMLLSSLGAFAADRVTTQIQYLSGTSREDAVLWEFRAESGRHSGVWTNIVVPSCWEQEGFGIYRYGQDKNPPNVRATYRHRFQLEDIGRQHVRLCFEGVMTDAHVTLNGASAGPVHSGGFSPFWFDVTDLVKRGENLLEVVVSENSAIEAINASERFADFWMFGGIHRPVFLEFLPREFIDRVAVDPRADGSLRMEVFTGAIHRADGIEVRLLDRQHKQLGAPLRYAVARNDKKVSLKTRFENIQPWSPETPHLYDLEVSLMAGNRPLHRVVKTIGFRTFEVVEHGAFNLNGRRIVLKGVCRAAFRPLTGRTLSAEDSREDVRLIKSMNGNAVRAGHYPADRHFLEACDELGLLVLEELFAWHKPLPDEEGVRLVREMVYRDQHHPSIVFWGNGNHRAFNPVTEKAFYEFDLQQRRALRMEPRYGNLPKPAVEGHLPVDTRFYPTYTELTKRLAGPYPVCPFETLHALYDGGGGASLREYMDALEQSPYGGGIFLWEMVDEAIARTDKGGELDPAGSRSCDGIVGPNHELEASYFTVRSVYSPVQVIDHGTQDILTQGGVGLKNNFHSTDLRQCIFERELIQSPDPVENLSVRPSDRTRLVAPSIAPGDTGSLDFELPGTLESWDILKLTATGPDGVLLNEWSWPLRKAAELAPVPGGGEPTLTHENGRIQVAAGGVHFLFEENSTRLLEVARGKTIFPLRNGPDLSWTGVGGSALAPELRDGVARGNPGNQKAKQNNLPKNSRTGRIAATKTFTPTTVVNHGDRIIIRAENSRNFKHVTWTVHGDGTLRLEYAYELTGIYESFGISFDSSEREIRSVDWLGRGPHPVWKNRVEGGTYGFWSKQNLETRPGKDWSYPFFEGCHKDTDWFRLKSINGSITGWILSSDVVTRWFTPKFGDADPLNAQATLPPGDISFLHAIPAIGEKWHPAADLGPSGQPTQAQGVYAGEVLFRFEPAQ